MAWPGAGDRPTRAPAAHSVEGSLSQERLARLYSQVSPVIYRRSLAILADPDEALDAVQDIFLTLHRKLHTFRGDADIMTWVYRVTTNHCLNRLRSRRTRRRLLEQVVRARAEQGPRQGPDLVELGDLIRHLATRTSASNLQAFLHYHYDEMSQQEIASLLGISERAVRKRIAKVAQQARKDGLAPDSERSTP